MIYVAIMQVILMIYVLVLHKPNLFDCFVVYSIKIMPDGYEYKYCVTVISNNQKFNIFTNKCYQINDKIYF